MRVWLVISVFLFLLVGGRHVGGRSSDENQFYLWSLHNSMSLSVEVLLTQGTNVTIFSLSMGDLRPSTPFPLIVNKGEMNKTIQYIYQEARTAIIVNDGTNQYCTVEATKQANDDVVFLGAIRAVLRESNRTQPSSMYNDRGIPTKVVRNTLNLTIPVMYGGEDYEIFYYVTYYLMDSWIDNQKEIVNAPTRVTLQSSEKAKSISLTFFEFTAYTHVEAEFEFPAICEGKSSAIKDVKKNDDDDDDDKNANRVKNPIDSASNNSNGTSNASSETPDILRAMPTFPDVFIADIQATMIQEKMTVSMHEEFSAIDAYSHSSISDVIPDSVGRVRREDWYVYGNIQASYHRTQVKYGRVTINPFSDKDEKLRRFFFPESDTCVRAQMGYNVISGTVGALMLYAVDVPPVYVGIQKVRNVSCMVWSSTVSGARIRWFWANRSAVEFVRDNSTVAGYGQMLMRIVVEGLGASPFFVQHPFFPQGHVFPSVDRRLACFLLNPSDPSCAHFVEPYRHVYEITSFVAINPKEFSIQSTSCANEAVSLHVIPSMSCVVSSSSTAVLTIFAVILAVLAAVAGGCCVWCRFAPMLRRLQKEITHLVAEAREDRAHEYVASS